MAALTDATSALLRAVTRNIGNFRGLFYEEIVSRAWASVTFTGARHRIVLRLEGEGAEGAAAAFVDTLEAAEFDLGGHIVADIALVSSERLTCPNGAPLVRIGLEALTVEDR